jgi:alpha-tubulin suppressor-like RCC1 family protein
MGFPRVASWAVSSCLFLTACGGETGGADPPLTGARAVSMGDFHACAALDDGTARCWGSNLFGALGGGNADPTVGTVTVKGLTGVGALEVGQSSTCAIGTAGAVSCWGQNLWGELGIGPSSADGKGPESVPTPVAASLSGPARALSAGAFHFMCAALEDGTVECWGWPVFTPGAPASVSPTNVAGVTNARAVAAGSGFVCALLDDGTVSCLGSGALGQNDANSNLLSTSATPLLVPDLADVVELAAGDTHACARLVDGTVKCWGSVGYGSAGSTRPETVSALSGAVSLAAGGQSTCAVLTNGTVVCLGALGNTGGSPVPGVANATSVTVGPTAACAVIGDGTIRCWGDTSHGLLGDGGTIDFNSVPKSESGVTVVDAPPAPAPS